MRPLLLSTAETLARAALLRRGVQSSWYPTKHGLVHCYSQQNTGHLAPVVLLHGLGTAATAFGSLIRHLGPHVRRIVAPDCLGHGFSGRHQQVLTPEEVLSATTDVLLSTIAEPAVLVGNSMGGAIALKFAVQHPDKVKGLVLVSPAGAPFSEADWATLTRTFDVRTRADAWRLLRRIYPLPPWFLSVIAHEMPAHFSSPAMRSLLKSPPTSAEVSPSELASVTAPTLLLWGLGDHLLPRHHLDYFKRHLPSHVIVEEPETFGHSPHLDASSALAERVVRFARTLDG